MNTVLACFSGSLRPFKNHLVGHASIRLVLSAGSYYLQLSAEARFFDYSHMLHLIHH